MNLFFGIVFILCGAAFAIYMRYIINQKSGAVPLSRSLRVKDVKQALDHLEKTGQKKRLYAELFGNAGCDELITAPFSDRPAAYYENCVYSVREESPLHPDSGEAAGASGHKIESELAHETSLHPLYLTDESGCRVYVDTVSFAGSMELTPACDRFEAQESTWLKRNQTRLFPSCDKDAPASSSPGLLGYRLKEGLLTPGQPLYVVGELYRKEDVILIGTAQSGKRRSFLCCTGDHHVVNDTKKQKRTSLVIGGILALIGIVLLFIR